MSAAIAINERATHGIVCGTSIAAPKCLDQPGIAPLCWRTEGLPMHDQIDVEGRLAMQRLRRVIELFQSIDPNMTMGAMESFFTIAEADAISVTDLSRAMRVSMSCASRYSRYLGKMDRHRNKGLELVAESENPTDSRKKVLTSTPRGELVLTQLEGIFGESARTRKQKAPAVGASQDVHSGDYLARQITRY